jgi:RNA polymerase sigma-70 factor (ECF subfamily)
MAGSLQESTETRDLLRRVQGGDRTALEALFARHRPSIRRYIELRLDNRVRGRADASDVVQETQLEAYRRLPDFLERRPMPFRLWLFRTAYERVLKTRRYHLDTRRRAVAREVALPEESSIVLAAHLLGSASAPDARMHRQEVARLVRKSLGELSELDQEILLMRSFEGLSNQEVAEVLQIEPATASQRFGRALLRLRKILLASGLMGLEG